MELSLAIYRSLRSIWSLKDPMSLNLLTEALKEKNLFQMLMPLQRSYCSILLEFKLNKCITMHYFLVLENFKRAHIEKILNAV